MLPHMAIFHWLNNVSVSVEICIQAHIYNEDVCVYTHTHTHTHTHTQISINQLSVDRRLSCSHVLAIVQSAAMNTGVYVSF